MRKIVAVLTFFIGSATISSAENLHLRQDGNWDCGYITYTDPNYLKCKGCEDRGLQFDLSGGVGTCISKANPLQNYKPLRDSIRDQEVERQQARKRFLEDVAREEEKTRREYAALKSKLKKIAHEVLLNLRFGQWHGAYDLIDTETKREELSNGDRFVKRHLDFMFEASGNGAFLFVMRGVDAAVRRNELTSKKEFLHEMDVRMKEVEKFENKWSGLGRWNNVSMPGESDTIRRLGKSIEKQKENLVDTYAALKMNATSAVTGELPAEKKDDCKERGGVLKQDLVTGFNTEPGWACHVRTITDDDIKVLIDEYENYLNR